jgi:short-subunit dehydrogenase
VTREFAPLVIESLNVMLNACSISEILYTPWASVYNASKAALKRWSETLRLELRPLGVKVVSLVAGSVETNIMSKGNVAREDSLSHKASEAIRRRPIGEDKPTGTTAEESARQLVSDVLGVRRG